MNLLILNNTLSIASEGGWTVAIVGWSIVFLALVLLVIIFVNIPKLINIKVKSRLIKEGKIKNKEDENLNIVGDVNAAISMALYLYYDEIHDEESKVITIKDINRKYSPWSSKIYGLNNLPTR